MQLKDKVVSGVAWSAAEKIGSMLLQMVVSFVLAGLLVPDDYGTMAVMVVFATVSLLIVDSGFSQALIRKPEPTQADYTSVFAFNLVVSWVLYALLVAGSFPLAAYYDEPEMTRIAPVLFLLLPVNAMCVIQNTILTRTFAFRKLSTITFLSSLVAGVVSIAVAVAGGGLWALVCQRLLTLVVKAVLLWWWGDWRPKGGWSIRPLREMFPYSSRLLATDLLNGIYNNVSSLFIGSMYTLQQLGYFSQAQKLKDLPVTSTVQAVQNVTFPALASIRDDERKFAESYRQVLMVMAFVMIPMMAGLVAVADDMFALIGDKWRPTVPYFRVLCLTGITQPIAMVAYNILKVRSNGRIIFQLEIVKKLIMTAILALTIPMSVEAVVWGLVVMSVIEMVVNFGATLRYTSVSVWHVVRDLLAPLVLAAVMCGSVYALSGAVQAWPIAVRLIVEVATGVAIYAGGAWVLRFEGMREMVRIVGGLMAKIKN